MDQKRAFSKDLIVLRDIESVINNITEKLRQDVLIEFKRSGGVVGISGGIDS